MGYQNPPIRWSELEEKLSDRSRPASNGGRPVTADMLTELRGLISSVCRCGGTDGEASLFLGVGRPVEHR